MKWKIMIILMSLRHPIVDQGCVFFFQAEDGIRDLYVTGVQTCALPISESAEPVYLPFLPVWAAMLPPILRMRWIAAYNVALASLAWFLLVTLVALMSGNQVASDDILRLGSAVAVVFMTAGALLSGIGPAVPFAIPLERYALVGALIGVSLLALPSFPHAKSGGD